MVDAGRSLMRDIRLESSCWRCLREGLYTEWIDREGPRWVKRLLSFERSGNAPAPAPRHRPRSQCGASHLQRLSRTHFSSASSSLVALCLPLPFLSLAAPSFSFSASAAAFLTFVDCVWQVAGDMFSTSSFCGSFRRMPGSQSLTMNESLSLTRAVSSWLRFLDEEEVSWKTMTGAEELEADGRCVDEVEAFFCRFRPLPRSPRFDRPRVAMAMAIPSSSFSSSSTVVAEKPFHSPSESTRSSRSVSESSSSSSSCPSSVSSSCPHAGMLLMIPVVAPHWASKRASNL